MPRVFTETNRLRTTGSCSGRERARAPRNAEANCEPLHITQRSVVLNHPCVRPIPWTDDQNATGTNLPWTGDLNNHVKEFYYDNATNDPGAIA